MMKRERRVYVCAYGIGSEWNRMRCLIEHVRGEGNGKQALSGCHNWQNASNIKMYTELNNHRHQNQIESERTKKKNHNNKMEIDLEIKTNS